MIVSGDFNFFMLNKEKCKPLQTVMDTFDLTNLVKDPTYFKNRENPTVLDLFLTNAPSLLCISSNTSD